MATERVQRLKDLMDMLMRQPPSPDRDRLLGEVRSRVVDLDTGVTPRAMLPVREPTPAVSKPQAPRKLAVRRKPEQPVPAPEPVSGLAELLSLDDTPLPHVPAYGTPTERPWTLGLRG